jgi:hypothetical protein
MNNVGFSQGGQKHGREQWYSSGNGWGSSRDSWSSHKGGDEPYKKTPVAECSNCGKKGHTAKICRNKH